MYKNKAVQIIRVHPRVDGHMSIPANHVLVSVLRHTVRHGGLRADTVTTRQPGLSFATQPPPTDTCILYSHRSPPVCYDQ